MRNRKNIIIVVMICVALLMATGYAYFATKLNINATGNITSNWNIYFSNITNGTVVGSASNNKTPSITATSATIDVNLQLPGDSMTYELTLTNGGSIGAIIEDIKAEAKGSTAIIYSISGIKIGDKLASGANKTITIKIEYDPATTSQPSLTNKTLTVTIDAVQDIGQTITESDPIIEDTTVCKIASDSTVPAGDYGAKYDCKVDPNKDPYTFYLFDNNVDGTSDLIMNANINASGEAVILGETSDTGEVAWNTSGSNINGPVTAMEYLYNATKSWTNVEPLNYTYYDRETHNSEWGYQSFISTDGIGVITKGDSAGTQVTIGASSEPLRARMPIIAEIQTRTDATAFLYDNIGVSQNNSAPPKPWAYWTLSATNISEAAWDIFTPGMQRIATITATTTTGVRPVITVKL